MLHLLDCTHGSDERLLLGLPRFDVVDPASQLIVLLRQDVDLRLLLFLQQNVQNGLATQIHEV